MLTCGRGAAVGATREESHALATVLREDDVIDHKPIRRGVGTHSLHASCRFCPIGPFTQVLVLNIHSAGAVRRCRDWWQPRQGQSNNAPYHRGKARRHTGIVEAA